MERFSSLDQVFTSSLRGACVVTPGAPELEREMNESFKSGDERVPKEAYQKAVFVDGTSFSLQRLRELSPDLIIAISVETVAALTGLSESTVWAKCDRNNTAAYEASFPQYKRYAGVRRTVWNFNAVQAYLQELFCDDSVSDANALLSDQRDLAKAPSTLKAKRGAK